VLNSNLIASTSEALDRANQVLVITHVQPDGDAISSLLATGHALQQLNKQFSLVCDDGLPARYRFLPLSDLVLNSPVRDQEYDLILALDAADESRMGRAYKRLKRPRPEIINIDHHVTNTGYGKINIIENQASSTTEVLSLLFPLLDIKISKGMAKCLLTGLVTDTLSFSTASVTSKTLEIASSLVTKGADLYEVSLNAISLHHLSKLKLWQIGLKNIVMEDGVIWTVINNGEREGAGHASASSFGLGNFMSNVYDAAMSAVLLEMGDGNVSVGFRSRPPYDVSQIAVSLGGGGHSLASGCTVQGPLAQAESMVIARCKSSISQQRIDIEQIARI
jgi:phosphoesterase RecJ-like protein